MSMELTMAEFESLAIFNYHAYCGLAKSNGRVCIERNPCLIHRPITNLQPANPANASDVLAGPTEEGVSQALPPQLSDHGKCDPQYIGVYVKCGECGHQKQPFGRSAPLGGYYCNSHEGCPGYDAAPHVGTLWPGETCLDFAYAHSHSGAVPIASPEVSR